MQIGILRRDTHTVYTGICAGSIIAAVSHRSFFAGRGGEDVNRQRARFLDELGFPRGKIAAAQQVHGNRVQVVTEPGTVAGTDGLITRSQGLFLSIATADCLPVFIWASNGALVALLHAGWRGTAAGIAGDAVRIIHSEGGIQPEDLAVLLGPCISQPFYEVGSEVARRFPAACLRPSRRGRFLLDLKEANRIQLIAAGVPGEAIFSDDRCTFDNSDVFFSYRRQGALAGRIIAVIGKITPT